MVLNKDIIIIDPSSFYSSYFQFSLLLFESKVRFSKNFLLLTKIPLYGMEILKKWV